MIGQTNAASEVNSPIILKNTLTNGSLASSTDGWTITQYNTLTQNDGYVTIKMTASGTGTHPNSQTYTNITGNTAATNQILYARAKVRGRATNVSFPRVYVTCYKNGATTATHKELNSIDGKIDTELNDGEWNGMSGIFQTFDSSLNEYYDYYRIAFGISKATPDDEMDIKEVMLVNLTRFFGRGNEPSKEWCDINLKNYLKVVENP